MDQKYLSDDVFEQIKDFNNRDLTKEQKLLIDKLILNEELKERYNYFGLCKGCKQINTGHEWCQPCNSKHFQQNFKNWTGENSDVNKLIQESQINAKNKNEILEWIKYDRFENVEYITKGGFGTVYRAFWKDGPIEYWNYETNQWHRNGYSKDVALKSLNNSKDITTEFLNEINLHLEMNNSLNIVTIYGITKDPKTNNFMMVMDYADDGNLRQNLNRNFNWYENFIRLRYIAGGLRDIHKNGLMHQDFHSGNILGIKNGYFITDLGLCKPADEKNNNKVYGVLPYVAPEVLRGKKYTQASDIYSFGIIIYEVINRLPPYHDMAHDDFLAIKICQGLRPRFNIKVPQLFDDLVKQCVDADPSKRPNAEYLCERFNQWQWYRYNKESEISKQIKEVEEFNEKQPSFTKSSVNTELTYTTHPQAIYTSRLLNFNNLPEPKNVDDEVEFSESIEPIDFTKLNINS
ncbi:kinase-like domain-containing protein [Glomus cerebriforme]|uniref:Kinase-like domain-containing protein n=1 Tax=Glomus cerebriforme TaxID=658196 RepID=A0A397SC15_9GLOM|nr:kinase-like domain-containing protein [Glomus cerebriforme]